MDIDKFVSIIKHIIESAPTNSTSSSVSNFDKFLFPIDDDLLSQDFQTPAEVGLAKWEFSPIYPVMKVSLSSNLGDGPSIDSMVDASKEYVSKMNQQNSQRDIISPIENIRDIVHKYNINEEMVGGSPTNNVGGGNIAGAVPGETPPVFKKKRKLTPVGRYGSRRMWLQDLKKNGK